ncbi:MAG: hypothetical protein LC667_07475 [Thioalkalivibrio sp.]|nr:hypothetical protein [Thioalkalivibrio sp.]
MNRGQFTPRRRSEWNHTVRALKPRIPGSSFPYPDQHSAAWGGSRRSAHGSGELPVSRESVHEFVTSPVARRALEEFGNAVAASISDTYRETTQNYARWLIGDLQRRLRETEQERSTLARDNEDLRKALLARQLEPRDIRAEFEQLAEQWREETGHMSSAISITQHPAYLRIIAMGPAVVPLILDDLQRTRSLWFTALRLLTGINPVQPGDKGNVRRLANAWITWGRERGLV